jgi:hypothetical protein
MSGLLCLRSRNNLDLKRACVLPRERFPDVSVTPKLALSRAPENWRTSARPGGWAGQVQHDSADKWVQCDRNPLYSGSKKSVLLLAAARPLSPFEARGRGEGRARQGQTGGEATILFRIWTRGTPPHPSLLPQGGEGACCGKRQIIAPSSNPNFFTPSFAGDDPAVTLHDRKRL